MLLFRFIVLIIFPMHAVGIEAEDTFTVVTFNVENYFLKKNNTPRLILLAGLSSDAGCEEIHVIVADEDTKKSLMNDGISVSETQPEGGVIGLCGLLGSLAPSRGVSSVTVIAETFGTIVEVEQSLQLNSYN